MKLEQFFDRYIAPVCIACGVVGFFIGMMMLASCATPTVTRTETVEVKVPVAVQPLRPDQVPTPPAPLGPRPQSLSAAADVLLSKWCEAVGYIVQADPLLRISAGGKAGVLAKYPECER